MGLLLWLLAAVIVCSAVGWLIRVGRRFSVADWGNSRLNVFDGLNRAFCQKVHGLQARPIEMPSHDGLVLVANHDSGLDPVALLAASPRPLRFLIASEEYERWWLKWLFIRIGCIPVSRSGRPDKALRLAIKAAQRGEVVAVFPQGGFASLRKDPGRLKKGALFVADQAGVPILPVRIDGVAGNGLTIGAIFKPSRLRLSAGGLLGADMASDTRHRKMGEFIVPEVFNPGPTPGGA